LRLDLNTERPRLGGLLWDRDFRLFWLGETTSMFGSSMAVVAMPLVAVLTLHASTFIVGLLQAFAWLPWLIIGLPVGAWIDRLPKRPVMLVCDAISFAVFVSVPVAAWLGWLTTAQLVVVALLGGSAKVFFSTAFGPYLRTIVAARFRPEANAKIEGSASAAQVAGPGLGGLAAQLLGAVSGMLVNGLTFACSAYCLSRIRAKEPPRAPRHERQSSLWSEIGEGIRFVGHDPYLRVMTLYAGLGNFGDAMFEAVVVVFLIRTVGVSAGAAGGLVGVISLGGILGAMVSVRIGRRFGTAWGMLLCEVVASPFALLIPLTSQGAGLMFFIVGGIVYLTGIGAANVLLTSFAQTYVPSHLLGRNNATSNLVVRGTMPLGGLTGAILGQAYGPRLAMWVSALVITLSVGVLFIGPTRSQRDLPTSLATAN
jgi:predicted MFS family arabinose efflux permease